MAFVVDDDVVIGRPLAGPLAGQIPRFSRWVGEQGYAPFTRHRKVLLAACFSRWLGRQDVSPRRISSEHPLRFLRSRARNLKVRPDDLRGVKHFMDFLRCEGVVPAEALGRKR